MTADVAFYVELAEQADGPLVELAIGNGRVAIPVAQATGQRVIGIDTSPAMLEQARARAAEAGVELDLREGDMRDLDPRRAGGAGLLPVPRAAAPADLGRPPPHLRARRRLAAAGRAVRLERLRLRPPGRRAARRRQHQDEPVPHTIRYAVGDNRIDIVLDDGGTSSLWWATKNEWLGLLDVAGLEVEALYGGFAGEPFSDDSRRVRRSSPAVGRAAPDRPRRAHGLADRRRLTKVRGHGRGAPGAQLQPPGDPADRRAAGRVPRPAPAARRVAGALGGRRPRARRARRCGPGSASTRAT